MQLLQEKHLGDEFSGVVTGITGGGVYVSIERFLVEGMVGMQDLPQSKSRSDHWRTDERTGRLTAGRSGGSVGIGEVVTVVIERVDLASRHLDLTITKMPQRADKPKPPRTKAVPADRGRGKRKGYKQGRRGRKGG